MLRRLPIDPDAPGFCLDCLARWRFEELRARLEACPRERPFPGRCLVCTQPLGPKRPMGGEDDR